MPRTDYDQVWDAHGNLVSETVVQRPLRVISPQEFQQAVQTLRTMVQTFYPGGVPTGEPTPVQTRNWLLSLTAAVRWIADEMDLEAPQWVRGSYSRSIRQRAAITLTRSRSIPQDAVIVIGPEQSRVIPQDAAIS